MLSDFTSSNLDFISIILGIVLLIAGRKMFWLVVAAIGFFVGVEIAAHVWQGSTGWLTLVVPLLAGLAGAILAIFLQKIAIGVAGFVVGGYVTGELFKTLKIADLQWEWVAFLIGGILGTLLVLAAFETGVLVVSCLAGAALIVHALHLTQGTATIVFIALAVIGFLIQIGLFRRKEEPKP